ncbi:MAG: phage coat protein [Dorea sp.]|nr:phage coat protein [Dorea sp.]
MPGIFNNKYFNAEVFGKYMETVPRVKQNAFIKAGIFNSRPNLKTMLTDQTGGAYITVPMVGRIGGTAQNYDGEVDITADGIGSYMQSMIVTGRMKAWEEKDFTQDITGKDFMAEIGKQVADYWDDVDQLTILAILSGIFGMTSAAGGAFVDKHTFDLTEGESAPDLVDATTLNNTIQKASGANKSIFTLAIMNSQISTNLENMQLINYGKYTDANGVEKDLQIGTWNGRTVMIDDDGTFDESTGKYTTYILGRNAFDYCDVGAKVPYETARDSFTDGGVDTLITRQRKLFAPRGISFIQPSSGFIKSPTDAQLATAANWKMVKNSEDNKFLDHRAVPIARIISKG